MTRWILLLATTLLAGCVGDGFGTAPSAHSLAWDGHEPNNSFRPPSQDGHPGTAANAREPTDREANLAKVPRNSPEWWAQQEAIAAEADGRLSKKLMICRGCLPPEPDARAIAIKNGAPDQ